MVGFSSDTLIKLLNGEVFEIIDLCNSFIREPLFLYSHTEEGLSVCLGVLTYVGIGGSLQVTLDDDTKVVCGKDQLFVSRDLQLVKADELSSGMPLLPLYTRLHAQIKGLRGYEECYDPIKNKYVFTHRFVGAWNYPEKYPNYNMVIHFNKLNNSPINFQLMRKDEHIEFHKNNVARLWNDPSFRKRKTASVKKQWEDPDFRKRQQEKCSKLAKEFWDNPIYREKKIAQSIKLFKSKEHRQLVSESQTKIINERWKDPEYRAYMSNRAKERQQDESFKEKMRAQYWENEDYQKRRAKCQSEIVTRKFREKIGLNLESFKEAAAQCKSLTRIAEVFGCNKTVIFKFIDDLKIDRDVAKSWLKPKNHKIQSIQIGEDCYLFTLNTDGALFALEDIFVCGGK